MRKFIAFGPSVLLIAAVLGALFLGPLAIKRLQVAQLSARVTLAQNRLEGANVLEEISTAQRAIADAVLPGLVHIESETNFAELRREMESQDNENGDSAEQPATPEPPRRFFRRPSLSTGAGWLWNDQGVIITNAHVVGDAETVRVELYDGRVRSASVVGADPQTDIAVIRIDAGSVIPLRRATGEAINIGERVFVFGSPFGIKFSMSQGIISGLGRGGDAAGMVGLRGGFTNFIQTDAAMNPGNSGGPVVDIRGKVIGMATAIANNVSQSVGPNGTPVQGQSAGIGFAIPLETIEAVVAQLLESDVVIRGYLGIQQGEFRDPEELARRTGFEGSGVFVGVAVPGQPADDAGIRAGDFITEINGRATPSFDVLRSIVSIAGPGQPMKFKVWRGGAFQDISVTLGAAFIPREGFRGIPTYVPGSEHMTVPQIREWIKNPPKDPPAAE